MRLLKLVTNISAVGPHAKKMAVTPIRPFATTSVRQADKPWKTTQDAKAAIFIVVGGFSAYTLIKIYYHMWRDQWRFPWVMEEHYEYEQRLKREQGS